MSRKYIDQNVSWVIAFLITGCLVAPFILALLKTEEKQSDLEKLTAEMERKKRLKEHKRFFDESKMKWGYEGSNSPKFWADLDPKYRLCRKGTKQSPIDLGETRVSKKNFDLAFDYSNGAVKMVQDSYNLSLYFNKSNQLILKNTSYRLKETVVHTPSEHTVDGRHYEAEIQFIHRSKKGKDVAVSVFVERGDENPFLKNVVGKLVDSEQKISRLKQMSPQDLFPLNYESYYYEGSHTRPPCKEGVKWFVFKEPVTMSEAQYEKFVRSIKYNARPTQQRGNRAIKSSHLSLN